MLMRIRDMGVQIQHNKKFEIYRENGISSFKEPNCLFIYFYSKCFVELNGEVIHVNPPAVIIFDVNFRQHYYAEDDQYKDDFVHFWIDESRSFLDEIQLPMNQVISLADNIIVPDLLQFMYEEFISDHEQKTKTLEYIFRLILLKVSELSQKEKTIQKLNRYVAMLEKVRTQLYLEPAYEWSAVECASQNGFSTTHFQKIYKNYFGCTFGKDVMTARLEHAKHLLLSTSCSVKEIAIQCGYHSETFFMKQFKKYVGMTPSQYRKK